MKETFVKFSSFLPIREAEGSVIDPIGRTARVVVITEGLGNLRDKNYYSAEAVKSAAEIFNGKQFYIDHPSKTDEEDRPERSVRDLAGYFYDVSTGEVRDPETGEVLQACFATLRFDESEDGQLAFDKVKTAIEYQKRFPNSKDVYAGISINGGGVSHPGTIGGMPVNIVTEIKEAFSADIVTKPARGGKFLALVREAQRAAQLTRQYREQSRQTASPAEDAGRREKKEAEVEEKDGTVKVEEARKKKKLSEREMEARKRLSSAEGLAGLSEKIQRVVNAINEPPDDPEELIADIQVDLDALQGVLDDLTGMQKAAEKEHDAAKKHRHKGEGDMAKEVEKDEEKKDEEKKDEEKKDEKEKEAEGEAQAKEQRYEEPAGKRPPTPPPAPSPSLMGEDEDEAMELGMNTDEELDDEMGDEEMGDETGDEMGDEEILPDEEVPAEPDREARMRFSCARCAAENEVLPPKGYRLVASEAYMGESERGLRQTVNRLHRILEAKEMRNKEMDREKKALIQEATRMKAELMGYRRAAKARKLLKEAGIPRDVLRVSDLLAFEPHQWPAHIKMVKTTLESQKKLNAVGGNGERGSAKGKDERGFDAAKAAFREAYRK